MSHQSSVEKSYMKSTISSRARSHSKTQTNPVNPANKAGERTPQLPSSDHRVHTNFIFYISEATSDEPPHDLMASLNINQEPNSITSQLKPIDQPVIIRRRSPRNHQNVNNKYKVVFLTNFFV